MKKYTLLTLICLIVLSIGSTTHAYGPGEIESMEFEIGEIKPFSLGETTLWLKEKAPEILRDLEEIRSLEPRVYEEILIFASTEVAFAEEMRKMDPEAFKSFLETARMEVHSELLGVQYTKATNTKKKEQLKKKLRSLTEKIFDARMAEHNAMVKDIEKELKELKHTSKVRAENRDKIIERHLNDLTTPDSEDLEWW